MKHKHQRRNEEIKKLLSQAMFDMKDPRVSPMTSLTMVEASPDMKHARVRVSVYDADDQRRRETVDALNGAAGFLSHEVGKKLRTYSVPAFKFTLDDSIAYSVHIAQVLSSLQKPEKEEDNAD